MATTVARRRALIDRLPLARAHGDVLLDRGSHACLQLEVAFGGGRLCQELTYGHGTVRQQHGAGLQSALPFRNALGTGRRVPTIAPERLPPLADKGALGCIRGVQLSPVAAKACGPSEVDSCVLKQVIFVQSCGEGAGPPGTLLQ